MIDHNHQTSNINHQKIINNQSPKLWATGYCLLMFAWILMIGYWLLPTNANAAEFNFEAILSKQGIDNPIKLSLPVDKIESIVALDIGRDGTSELLLGSPAGFTGRVWLVRLDGSVINSWLPYDKRFTGGVNVAAGDLDGDGVPEIITAPAGGGGPHVRVFNGYGQPKLTPGFFATDPAYRGETKIFIQPASQHASARIITITYPDGKQTINRFTGEGTLLDTLDSLPTDAEGKQTRLNNTVSIAVNHQNLTADLVLPEIAPAIERNGKVIIIDLSDQRLSYYQDGFRVNSFRVSTGKRGYETPVGEFALNNKIDRAYSRRYGLYMPYWMSFIGGLYGIHELPEWPNGSKEGENHLGTPVSHGCVRLGVGAAEKLYQWAEVGTPVIVQR